MTLYVISEVGPTFWRLLEQNGWTLYFVALSSPLPCVVTVTGGVSHCTQNFFLVWCHVCLEEGKLLFHCSELVHTICFDSELIALSLPSRFLLVIFRHMAAYCKGSAYAEQKDSSEGFWAVRSLAIRMKVFFCLNNLWELEQNIS